MKKHFLYYLLLGSVLTFGLVLILSASPDRGLQMLFLGFLSLIYAAIGIAHHLINHDLVFKIVVEYVLIACLGIAIAFFIFKGGFGL
ncbi:MAG: hypothetical protein AAB520_02075 [Patescibacteria group bacterium]